LKNREVFVVDDNKADETKWVSWDEGGWRPPEAPKPPEFDDRRKKRDWVVRAVPYISAVAWLSAAVSLYFLDRARPPKATFWTTFNDIDLSTFWDPRMLQYSFIVAVEVALVCVLGFLFNLMRHKRKTDRFSSSIFVLFCLTIIYMVYLAVRFGYLIF
jgi:hypothetical protein